jgi:hypothetical protein
MAHNPDPQEGGKRWIEYQAPQSLTIQRAGSVDWHVTGAYHCGVDNMIRKDGRLTTRWEVELTAAPKLDQRGLMFDQSDMAHMMEMIAREPTGLSCERLVEWVGHVLLGRAKLEDPIMEILGLRVRLSPDPFVAWIEGRWLFAPKTTLPRLDLTGAGGTDGS